MTNKQTAQPVDIMRLVPSAVQLPELRPVLVHAGSSDMPYLYYIKIGAYHLATVEGRDEWGRNLVYWLRHGSLNLHHESFATPEAAAVWFYLHHLREAV